MEMEMARHHHQSDTPEVVWKGDAFEPSHGPARPPKKRHVFRWVFLGVQLAFLLWIVVGVHSGSQTSCGTLSAQDCHNAHAVGGTIATGLIVTMWAAVDIIMGSTYAIFKLARRR